jgi:hypothetical protein
MSLEFEKLTNSLDQMAQAAVGRIKNRREMIAEMSETLKRYAEDWPAIEAALDRAAERADDKFYRGARPITQLFPLDACIDPLSPPEQATIIATDGSQIMPDRHAAHLYYLINVGGIIYRHGSGGHYGGGGQQGDDGRVPEPFTVPELVYPTNDREAADFLIASGEVSVKRDLKEIGILADKAWENRKTEYPLLAVLDQRLLYWPVAGQEAASTTAARKWMAAMTKLNDSRASLAGYIDRPMTSGVINLLLALAGMDDPVFDWKSLGRSSLTGGLTDAALFSRILGGGQRSVVFVGVSQRNAQFAEHDPDNEVCFFYFNPGRTGQSIARVDIPMWVAREETAVTVVHALINHQCLILGDYPYVLARADELAVIGHQDHEELDFMIDLYMQRYGVEGHLTAKQGSKELARGGKTRHRGL